MGFRNLFHISWQVVVLSNLWSASSKITAAAATGSLIELIAGIEKGKATTSHKFHFNWLSHVILSGKRWAKKSNPLSKELKTRYKEPGTLLFIWYQQKEN